MVLGSGRVLPFQGSQASYHSTRRYHSLDFYSVLNAGTQRSSRLSGAVTPGAVGTSGASGDERRGRRQGPGRQQESRQPPAAALALPIPAGLEQRTPRGHRGE